MLNTRLRRIPASLHNISDNDEELVNARKIKLKFYHGDGDNVIDIERKNKVRFTLGVEKNIRLILMVNLKMNLTL